MTDERTEDAGGQDRGAEEAREQVGSVGEEAAKLLNALNDWAKETGAGHAQGFASAASGVAAGLHDVNEHLATGGQDCRYCPVCQVISLVRQTSPEVRTHLSVAASSLLQAAAGLLATSVPDEAQRSSGVEKITLDDD